MRMGALVCDGGCAGQLRIQARIDLGGRIRDLLLLILIDNGRRDRFAVSIFEDELRFEIEIFGFGCRCRNSDDEAGNNGKEKGNFSHGSAPYPLFRAAAQAIF